MILLQRREKNNTTASVNTNSNSFRDMFTTFYSAPNTTLQASLTFRLRSFGVIRIWISDPRFVWIMVHQRNR